MSSTSWECMEPEEAKSLTTVDYTANVVAQKPLVHCITNFVSMDIMANILNAIGASPAMASPVSPCCSLKGFAPYALANTEMLGKMSSLKS